MPFLGVFLTPTITKVSLYCNGHPLGSATGFYMKAESGWSLVTNWHVLSGRNPTTGQPIHQYGAVPDRCSLALCALHDRQLVWHGFQVDLGDALLGTATWLEHPIHGQGVDVAVLPLPGRDLGLVKDLLDPTGHDSNMIVDVAADVFLPGYPLGLTGGGQQPLWKRASVASSPELDEMGHIFYVDTATREGMSGAPCFAISSWRHYARQPGSLRVKVVENPMCWRLLAQSVREPRRRPSAVAPLRPTQAR